MRDISKHIPAFPKRQIKLKSPILTSLLNSQNSIESTANSIAVRNHSNHTLFCNHQLIRYQLQPSAHSSHFSTMTIMSNVNNLTIFTIVRQNLIINCQIQRHDVTLHLNALHRSCNSTFSSHNSHASGFCVCLAIFPSNF